MTTPPNSRRNSVVLFVVLFPVLMTGAKGTSDDNLTYRDSPVANQIVPDSSSQIYNQNGSAPEVFSSLIEDGLSEGTVDGGGNIDGDPLLADQDGADNIPGSVDDDVKLQAVSPAVDSGDNSLLPLDVFDIDGDGDVSEPFPTDINGMERTFDGGGGTAVVDMGAHERDASDVAIAANGTAFDQVVEFDLPYPHPVTGSSELTFRLPATEHVEITVYDVLGREQLVLFEDVAQAKQQYLLEIPAARLSSGVYFAKLKSRSFSETTNFVVVQ